ncbi:MAG TPA: SMC-Scp complex subunit ScpB [Oligoflexia bacterium]|nr:SMC-Scp complex subunit ScpB [Oligoflexia bacterium]HMP47839.1 SMC-Scp complex subunit ScpB [Oligoflexia bacterium]
MVREEVRSVGDNNNSESGNEIDLRVQCDNSVLDSYDDLDQNFRYQGDVNESEYSPTLIEGLSGFLFVSPRPLTIEKLIELSISAGLISSKNASAESDIREAIDKIAFHIKAAALGIELVEVAGAFQFRTIPKIKRTLKALITPKMKRLSKAAAETLAVIAYKQPVPRAEIEAIRGVDALPTLKTLLDARLVRIVGREDTPGSPALYGTTDFFLERFGLKNLSELPSLREISLLEGESADSEKGDSEQLELFPDAESTEDGNYEVEDDEVNTKNTNFDEPIYSQLEISDTELDLTKNLIKAETDIKLGKDSI